jgi:hypothetical protein
MPYSAFSGGVAPPCCSRCSRVGAYASSILVYGSFCSAAVVASRACRATAQVADIARIKGGFSLLELTAPLADLPPTYKNLLTSCSRMYLPLQPWLCSATLPATQVCSQVRGSMSHW